MCKSNFYYGNELNAIIDAISKLGETLNLFWQKENNAVEKRRVLWSEQERNEKNGVLGNNE